MIKGCGHFLNGKQYMIPMRFSTQNPLIVFSISYTVPEIILKKRLKNTKKMVLEANHCTVSCISLH